ncbi:MAG: NADH-quinone oxidoreductase subunit L, partial [Candidatus Marinimicrobia bacterium]|nr:NADH-quinone oxidoreductase subunit L [Candidatus Neomarinimicrobiota bacterium]
MIENPMILFPLLILFLPLISFIIVIFFGKKLPRQGDWVAVGSIVTTFLLACYLFLQMLLNYDPGFSHGASFSWINLGEFKIDLGILVDNLTIVMLLIVTLVSSCTHIFSIAYMKGDIRYNRYFAYLGLFTFSMNGIVLADNLISMYMSWELVGVSSYLLIGHWFEKDSAANASKKAFLTNRVGDIGFFIGIMLLYSAVGAFAFSPIFESIAGGQAIAGTTLTIAGLGIFMGAVGKSSQFPLHIWLPDAMEGPTPVSALMHAATMVAAGVYMCVRLFPIFTPSALIVIAYIGAITAILAALIAVSQNDIKKVLAYSTVSQLGFMILAVGTGVYTAAFFHLLTHAMFKANLFYCSGSVIHSMHHALHKA